MARPTSPRLSSAQLGTDASLRGLGEVKVNLDLAGLQGLLQNLTNAIDTKFEGISAQLSELQQDMGIQQKHIEITRRELDDVSVKLSGCVSFREFEELKTMESRLSNRFGSQLAQLQVRGWCPFCLDPCACELFLCKYARACVCMCICRRTRAHGH